MIGLKDAVMVNRLQVIRKPAGVQLYTKGQSADAMFFILRGSVELTDERTEIAGNGALIGALEFLNKMPRKTTARCVTETDLFVITEDNIISLFQQRPRIGYTILKAVAAEAANKELNENKDTLHAETSKPLAKTLAQVLPDGHPHFETTAPAEFDEYIFYSSAECPVCQTEFSAVKLRESRLITKQVASDFRIIYENMEPLWYYIWVCPGCGFAYPRKQFRKITPRQAAKLKKALVEGSLQFEYSSRRTLSEVFAAYYLSLYTFDLMEAAPQLYGNLWMRLVWLYEDCGEPEWALEAAAKALNYFEEALLSGRRSDAGDQQLYIIMAELNLRLGKKEEALRCLMEAVNLRQGNDGYRRLAADRIQDLRSQ